MGWFVSMMWWTALRASSADACDGRGDLDDGQQLAPGIENNQNNWCKDIGHHEIDDIDGNGEFWGNTHVTGRPCWRPCASVAAVDIRGNARAGTFVIQRTTNVKPSIQGVECERAEVEGAVGEGKKNRERWWWATAAWTVIFAVVGLRPRTR